MPGTDGSVDKLKESMGTAYSVGDDSVPLIILSSPVGGPLESICSEAEGLLQLPWDLAKAHETHMCLLVFIDCLILHDILHKWEAHTFHPRPNFHQRKLSTLISFIQFLSCDSGLCVLKSHFNLALGSKTRGISTL